MDILRQLNIKLSVNEEQICLLASNFLHQYADIFNKPLADSYLKNYEIFEIIPIENPKPMRVPVRQFSSADQKVISEKVADLLSNGVIETSFSPWRCLPVVVDKKDGSKRMTINYKPVNFQTKFDAFPLPVIEELIPNLANCSVFSKLDFSQFYHQIPLIDSDREKTSFFADGNLFQYTRLPFGLKNAVAACSRIMNDIFASINGCVVYLDDILVFGETKEDHDDALCKVFEKNSMAWPQFEF